MTGKSHVCRQFQFKILKLRLFPSNFQNKNQNSMTFKQTLVNSRTFNFQGLEVFVLSSRTLKFSRNAVENIVCRFDQIYNVSDIERFNSCASKLIRSAVNISYCHRYKMCRLIMRLRLGSAVTIHGKPLHKQSTTKRAVFVTVP